MMSKKPSLLLAIIVSIICCLCYFDIFQYITLDNIKSHQTYLHQRYQAAPVLFIVGAFVILTLYSSLPVPGQILFTLLFAAIFGFWGSFIITSFSTAIGGSLAFLLSRYLFRKPLQTQFPKQYSQVNRGIERDGGIYLFTIRMVPILPFFMVNILMGLTTLKIRHFYIATQIGMLASTAVFANAGTQLSQVNAVGDLFTPSVISSLTLLAILPIAGKWLIGTIPTVKTTNNF